MTTAPPLLLAELLLAPEHDPLALCDTREALVALVAAYVRLPVGVEGGPRHPAPYLGVLGMAAECSGCEVWLTLEPDLDGVADRSVRVELGPGGERGLALCVPGANLTGGALGWLASAGWREALDGLLLSGFLDGAAPLQLAEAALLAVVAGYGPGAAGRLFMLAEATAAGQPATVDLRRVAVAAGLPEPCPTLAPRDGAMGRLLCGHGLCGFIQL